MKTCSIDGCEKKVMARGLCNAHYVSEMRKGVIGSHPKKAPERVKGCSITGCENGHYAHGLCQKHYQQTYRKDLVPKWKREPILGCIVDGCSNPVYAKGLCKNHYSIDLKVRRCHEKGIPLRRDLPECAIEGCTERACSWSNPLCAKHSYEHKHPGRKYGEAHHSWKGGVAEYPFHSELKRNRLTKLKAVNYECEVKGPLCTGKATMTHHKDGDKTNHAVENLQACCSKCHGLLSRGIRRSYSQPYKKRYAGKMLKEWAEESGCSYATVRQCLVKGKENGFSGYYRDHACKSMFDQYRVA